jgi:hypothetical protein
LLRGEDVFKQYLADERFQRVLKALEEKKSGNG